MTSNSRLRTLWAPALLGVLMISSCAPPAPTVQELRLFGRDGPTSLLMRNLVTAFNCSTRDSHVTVTTFSLDDPEGRVAEEVARTSATIGFLGRYLKQPEKQLARSETFILADAGVIAVGTQSSRVATNDAELRQIFAGVVADLKTLAVTPRGTLARDVVERFIAANGHNEAVVEVASVREALAYARDHADGGAVVPLASVVDGATGIRILSVDKVLPTAATVQSGEYPWSLLFSLLLPLNGSPPGADAFIEFARSERGRRAVLATYSDFSQLRPAC